MRYLTQSKAQLFPHVTFCVQWLTDKVLPGILLHHHHRTALVAYQAPCLCPFPFPFLLLTAALLSSSFSLRTAYCICLWLLLPVLLPAFLALSSWDALSPCTMGSRIWNPVLMSGFLIFLLVVSSLSVSLCSLYIYLSFVCLRISTEMKNFMSLVEQVLSLFLIWVAFGLKEVWIWPLYCFILVEEIGSKIKFWCTECHAFELLSRVAVKVMDFIYLVEQVWSWASLLISVVSDGKKSGFLL